jgi:hypothetical protein
MNLESHDMVVVIRLANAIHEFVPGHPSDWNVDTKYGVLSGPGCATIKSHQLDVMIEDPGINASRQLRRTHGDCCTGMRYILLPLCSE